MQENLLIVLQQSHFRLFDQFLKAVDDYDDFFCSFAVNFDVRTKI